MLQDESGLYSMQQKEAGSYSILWEEPGPYSMLWEEPGQYSMLWEEPGPYSMLWEELGPYSMQQEEAGHNFENNRYSKAVENYVRIIGINIKTCGHNLHNLRNTYIHFRMLACRVVSRLVVVCIY